MIPPARTTILIYLYRLLKSLDLSDNLEFFNDLCSFKSVSSELQIFAPLNLNDLCPAAEVYKGICNWSQLRVLRP